MNIGIIGRARAGKDTAGKWLVDNRGYRRVGFADALKAAVLGVNPIVGTDEDDLVSEGERLADVLDFWGPERAKDVPEVRRLYQEFGRSMRAVDPDIWIRPVLAKAMKANDTGVPVVVTDVRYPNEVESLRRAGFHLVYIERPGVPQMDHESENSLSADDADYTIQNFGFLEDLYDKVERFWDRVHQHESARMAMKF
ncbi:deoxynucleotide monophosphate kinase family protein [Streptomyces ardesiacus]